MTPPPTADQLRDLSDHVACAVDCLAEAVAHAERYDSLTQYVPRLDITRRVLDHRLDRLRGAWFEALSDPEKECYRTHR